MGCGVPEMTKIPRDSRCRAKQECIVAEWTYSPGQEITFCGHCGQATMGWSRCCECCGAPTRVKVASNSKGV